MKPRAAVHVGVRELKNRLTTYLKLAKAEHEVVVTERGKPIAVIQAVGAASSANSREARLAGLAARGEIVLPERTPSRRIRRAEVSGRPLSEEIVADRR
jgi:prevent-host-death family protein